MQVLVKIRLTLLPSDIQNHLTISSDAQLQDLHSCSCRYAEGALMNLTLSPSAQHNTCVIPGSLRWRPRLHEVLRSERTNGTEPLWTSLKWWAGSGSADLLQTIFSWHGYKAAPRPRLSFPCLPFLPLLPPRCNFFLINKTVHRQEQSAISPSSAETLPGRRGVEW